MRLQRSVLASFAWTRHIGFGAVLLQVTCASLADSYLKRFPSVAEMARGRQPQETVHLVGLVGKQLWLPTLVDGGILPADDGGAVLDQATVGLRPSPSVFQHISNKPANVYRLQKLPCLSTGQK